MKFRLLETKTIKGFTAKIMLKNATVPIEVFFQVQNFQTFDQAVKSQFKDVFKSYTTQPTAVWEDQK